MHPQLSGAKWSQSEALILANEIGSRVLKFFSNCFLKPPPGRSDGLFLSLSSPSSSLPPPVFIVLLHSLSLPLLTFPLSSSPYLLLSLPSPSLPLLTFTLLLFQPLLSPGIDALCQFLKLNSHKHLRNETLLKCGWSCEPRCPVRRGTFYRAPCTVRYPGFGSLETQAPR